MIDKMKSKQKQHGIKLRIIGGQMRGRTVNYHGAAFTRPMKDNIREKLDLMLMVHPLRNPPTPANNPFGMKTDRRL